MLDHSDISTQPLLSRSKHMEPEPSAFARRRDFIIGIVLLLCVVFLWTGSNFLTQGMYDEGYEKPFLVTYLNTSSFAVYLIPYAWKLAREKFTERGRTTAVGRLHESLDTRPSESLAIPFRARSVSSARRHRLSSHSENLPPLTIEETAQLASTFCFFWFIANWAVNASLDLTSVASSTILASTSGFFTLGIGRLFKVETVTMGKLAAIVASFAGVLLVSLADKSKATPAMIPPSLAEGSDKTPATANPLLGDFLALLSAFFYALYVTLLKIKVKTESRMNMQLFFGFVGLFNVLSLWPIAILLHYVGLEKLEWPPSGTVWTVIAINMFVALSGDYIYVLAMLKTTPLLVTIGLCLTIPLAVIGDFFWNASVPGFQSAIGGVLVLVGFVAIGVEGEQEEVSAAAEAEVTARGSLETDSEGDYLLPEPETSRPQ